MLHNFWICSANRYIKISLVDFREKKFVWGNLIFLALRPFFTLWLRAWSNWARLLLIGSLKSQDMIRILKQWRHEFSGKHFYVMDIVWILYDVYVWRSKFMVLWSFLRICYVSLLECKGPWMLKTVINCHVRNRGLQN